MNLINQPKEGDYPAFYATYLNLTSGNDYEKQITVQNEALIKYFHDKGPEWSEKAYAEGKWTPKEVLGHIIDTERIMTFRALCFARGEKASLPGFDQDPYVLNARFGEVPTELLLKDFVAQRKALLTMMKILPESSLDHVGHANGNPITPRALFWIIPGHLTHHLRVLNELY